MTIANKRAGYWSGWLLLFCCCLPAYGLADRLVTPPEPWRGQLQAIPEADLSGAEPYARTAIRKQRQQVDGLLAKGDTQQQTLAEAYGRLGALYQVHGLPGAAQGCYENAMALDPKAFRWFYYAGYLAARSGRHREAIRLYQAARELRPHYPALPLRLAESLLELGRLDQAEQALQPLTERAGVRAQALYDLAQIDLLRHRYEQAATHLQEVLRLDPQADRTYYPLARALRTLGRNEQARTALAKRGKRKPQIDDPMIHDLEGLNQGARRRFAKGLEATRKQEFAAAAKAFGEGLEIEPQNIHARISYARALFLSDQPKRAAEELERVLKQAPKQGLALFLSAILLERDGRLQQAEQRYRQLLRQEPDHYGAHYCLANRLYLDGRYREAAEHYQAALAANPDIPPARLYELLAMKRSGLSDREIEPRLQRLVRRYPDDLLLRYTLARLLLLSDDPKVRDEEKARQLANALVQEAFTPPHVELQARIAAALGHFQQAVELQEQLLPALQWLGGEYLDQARAALAAYRQRQLPSGDWDAETLLIHPPSTDAQLLFREYPAPAPF